MNGYLAVLRRLPRAVRRERVEQLLQSGLDGLTHQSAVADRLAGIGPTRLVHYTFDEPDLGDDDACTVQFTYHLAEAICSRDFRAEIRGSGLATIDDHGRVRLSEVDAELIQFCDDSEDEDIPSSRT
jgi:hypothetical protein